MAKAKFAGLFNDSDEDSEILTYAAPKVPQKPRSESTVSNSSDSVVLKACPVSCFRLIDNNYKSCGKLGIAILYTPKKHECRLILYASRDKQVAFAQMHVNFAFTISSNNYASFYDSTNQGWSVLFDSDSSLSDFAAHVCLGKFFCSNQSGILTQDIASGDGAPVQVGDSVEVRYSGNLVDSHKVGREFDSNRKSDKLFRFKLGARKVVAGWEEGLVNMMKGGRRVLVIPPNKGYGDKGMPGRIPANSTLVFDITVIRVKHSRGIADVAASDKTGPKENVIDSPPLPSIPDTSAVDKDADSEEEDMTVKQRTRSIAEKLSFSESGSPVRNQNAKLIARMAKMGGQAVLPGGEVVPSSGQHASDLSATASSPVDQHEQAPTHNVAQPKPHHPVEAPRYNSFQHSSNPPMQPVYNERPNPASAFHPTVIPPYPPQQTSAPVGYPNAMHSGQLMAYQPQAAVMAMQQQQLGLPFGALQSAQNSLINQSSTQETKGEKSQDVHTAMLVSETRQQNTEVRIAIGKLQDKVDKVWERMSDMKGSSGPSYPSVESGTLLQNLTRIIQENERLKQEVLDYSGKTEKQNEKISELLQKNQSFMESSNRALELKNDDFKASATQSQQRVLDLEQDKLELTRQLSELTGEVTQLQCLVNEYKKGERDLKDKLVNVTSTIESNKDEMASLRTKVDETTKSLQTSQASLKEESVAKRKVENQLENSEDEVNALKHKLSNQEQDSSARIGTLEENMSKLNSELEKTRKEYEKEIDSLREKLREERAAGFSEKSLELNKMEEEITQQWKEKCERMVRAERERLTRQMKEVEEEKRRAESEVEQYQGRIENFRSKALEMKQRFKDEIDSLKDELEEAKSREREMDREELIKEVRRLMNQVFQTLRQKVLAERRYRGERVLGMLKGTIRKLTLRLMGQDVSSSEDESESDDEAEFNEIKERYQSETSKLRQSVLEQQMLITSLEGKILEQQQQLQRDLSLLAEKEGALDNLAKENQVLIASMKERRTPPIIVEAEVMVEESNDKKTDDNLTEQVQRTVSPMTYDEPLVGSSSSSEEETESEQEVEEKEETEIPRLDAEETQSFHETSEPESTATDTEAETSINAVDEENKLPNRGFDEVDVEEKEAIITTEEVNKEPQIEAAGPVKKVVEEISNPYSGGLTPPPLSSHGDSSSDEEDERPRGIQDPLGDVGDDGDGTDFLTPPSGGDESETKSPAKQIDSSEFDDILTRSQPSGSLLTSKANEPDATVDPANTEEAESTARTNDNIPLFGDDSDDDYDGIFGSSKKENEVGEGANDESTAKPSPIKETAKPKKEDLNDDKPKPPPLFDDDDDDYDLFR